MIHDLSFGPKYPGIHNPLDGTKRILVDTSGTFRYYIKVGVVFTFVIMCFTRQLFSVTAAGVEREKIIIINPNLIFYVRLVGEEIT